MVRYLLLIALVGVAACDPVDRRPGLWLTGTPVTEPVADWTFSNDHNEIFVETRTWYRVPHSITTTVVTVDGTLYVPSLYREGGNYPEERFWNRNLVRDPHARLQIGDSVYERKASLVTDADERARVLAAFAAKYPYWRELLKDGDPALPKIILIRMDAAV